MGTLETAFAYGVDGNNSGPLTSILLRAMCKGRMAYGTVLGPNNVPSIERLPVHGGLLPKINIALLAVPILSLCIRMRGFINASVVKLNAVCPVYVTQGTEPLPFFAYKVGQISFQINFLKIYFKFCRY